MQETGEGVEEEKGEREIKGQGKFVVVSLLAFIRLFAGEKNISRNIYVKFGFSFFFSFFFFLLRSSSLEFFLENAFAFPRSLDGQLCPSFLPDYTNRAKKGNEGNCAHKFINERGKWFLSNDPRYNAANRTSVD